VNNDAERYLASIANKKKAWGGRGKEPKYKNKITPIDGIKFHSAKEAGFYVEMKRQRSNGEIKDFKMQVRYPLKVNDILICTYVADFVPEYWGGGIQVIDVKSEFTRTLPEYRKKKKLMKAIFGITIKEV